MKSLLFKLLGALLLVCLLAFLYLKSVSVDAKQHVRISAELRHMHLLEERLGQLVLQKRVGLLLNNDPLNQTQDQIQAIVAQLETEYPDLFLGDGAALSQRFIDYRKAREETRSLIDTFKSQHSVLRNSVRYFPVAVSVLLEGPGHLKDGDPLEIEVRDHLLDDMLVYQINPTEAKLISIQDSMSKIAQRSVGYPKAQRQQMEALLMHAGIMTAYKDETDRTVDSILNSRSSEILEDVFDLYSQQFEQAEHEAGLYRFWLMLFALFGLLYGVYSLIRISKARDELGRSLSELEFQKFALDQHSIVSIADRSGKIIYTNNRFSQVSKYTREELLGQDHRMLNSGYHPSSFFKEMWQTIGHGKVWQGEVKNRRKDGSFYWVDSTIVPFMDQAGKPVRYVSIRTDITERKQAEEVMLRAKLLAEEASQAKSDFLANMSHEIRTPMNGIIGMTELALDTDLNAEQREYVGLVKASADALLTIINDILDFSKIEAGKMDIELIEFSLQDMLSQTVRSIALRAHQKGLELLLDIDPAIPQMLMGDPGRLRQIMLNLIGNAIKFTDHGEILVRVSLGEAQGAADVLPLRFSVSDTGIGIPADKQQAIFESFSQADSSTTRKYGGTGLGLTISTRLVELMHGSIRVESEVGKGSTFHVEVTLGRAGHATKPRYETGKLAGMKVLVVDDSATNREIAVRLLQGWNMRPTAVADGEAAIAELDRVSQADGYQLLLLDVRMPGADGFAVVEHLRAHPVSTAVPIMMLTSEGQRGDAARCRDLGVAAYLLKPFAQADLFDAIMNTLGLSEMRDAPLVTRHSIQQNKTCLRVLLAEDNAINQTLATRLLNKFGHEVEVAGNGLIAVDKWRAGGYDLILMDVDMPELNGYGATERIREAERSSGAHIPIIGLTAHAMQGAREECLRHGMDGFLTKPIDTEALWVELEGIKSSKLGAEGSFAPHGVRKDAPEFVFDLGRVMQLMAGDSDLFVEMVNIYMTDYPRYISDLSKAVDAGDAGQITYLAHTIKGMLSVFAVETVAEIAAHIEENPGADHCADVAALSDALDWLARELNVHLDEDGVMLDVNLKGDCNENRSDSLV
jgi:PAS domain S-box-containing protein